MKVIDMGLRVKMIREEREVQQKDMAELLKITPATYSKKENGDLRFSLIEAQKIAEFFGKQVEEIFFE